MKKIVYYFLIGLCVLFALLAVAALAASIIVSAALVWRGFLLSMPYILISLVCVVVSLLFLGLSEKWVWLKE